MDTQGINDRLTELAQLKDGWLDGEGKAVCLYRIAEVREILSSEPHIYPMEDGGIEVVWGDHFLAIELSPNGTAWASINGRTLKEEVEG